MRSSTNLDSLHDRGDGSKVNWMANSEDVMRLKVTGNDPLSNLLSSLKNTLGTKHISTNTIDAILEQLDHPKAIEENLSKARNVDYSQVLDSLDDALRKQWPHNDSAQLQRIILPSNL
jgi:predicted ATPase